MHLSRTIRKYPGWCPNAGTDKYLQFAAGEIASLSLFLQIGFNTSIVLFFLAGYYHSLVRADYPEILVITTTTKELAGRYGANPEEIVKRLGKSA